MIAFEVLWLWNCKEPDSSRVCFDRWFLQFFVLLVSRISSFIISSWLWFHWLHLNSVPKLILFTLTEFGSIYKVWFWCLLQSLGSLTLQKFGSNNFDPSLALTGFGSGGYCWALFQYLVHLCRKRKKPDVCICKQSESLQSEKTRLPSHISRLGQTSSKPSPSVGIPCSHAVTPLGWRC